MRLLLTTDYYWPYIGGGVEAVVQQLAERLVRRGHTVSVLTLRTGWSRTSERLNGVVIHRVPALPLTRLLGMQLTVPLDPLKFTRVLASFRPDVLHLHNQFFTSSLLAMLLHKRMPTVFTLHLGQVRIGNMVALYEQLISRRLLAAADVVTAVSCQAAAVWPGARVIENAVDTDVFRPYPGRKDGFTVMCVGRLIRNKGPQRLLEAIPYLDPGIRVVFIGDGPLRTRLQRRAWDLGVAGRTTFVGLRNDVACLLPSGSLLVRPSDTDALSLAVLEALACGLPVIASQAAAGDLVKHGINGYQLADMSPQEIACYINRLYRSPETLSAMSFAARQTVERFSWEKTVDAYEEVYRGLLKGYPYA